jgi:hypothetical protein
VLQATVRGVQTAEAVHCPLATYARWGSVGQEVMLAVQVVRSSQPPLPSQFPSCPQAPLAAAVQVAGCVARGGLPLPRLVHTPALPESLQLWQPPAQVLSQQTPSAEQTSPLPQSLLATQDSPAASLSPQRLLVLMQVRPPVQSASEAQVLRHVGLLALHT